MSEFNFQKIDRSSNYGQVPLVRIAGHLLYINRWAWAAMSKDFDRFHLHVDTEQRVVGIEPTNNVDGYNLRPNYHVNAQSFMNKIGFRILDGSYQLNRVEDSDMYYFKPETEDLSSDSK